MTKNEFVAELLAGSTSTEQEVLVRVQVPDTDDAPLYVVLWRSYGLATAEVFDHAGRRLVRRIARGPCDHLALVIEACEEAREAPEMWISALRHVEDALAEARADADGDAT